MDQEMTEMNRRLANTRKVWETVSSMGAKSSSSDTHQTSVSLMEKVNEPVSPTKSLPDTTPTPSLAPGADATKLAEEKPSIAPGFATVSKRPEHQVCKVKPQQQQPSHEDVIRLNQSKQVTASTRSISNMNVQQNPLSKYSYILPVRQNALFAGSDSNTYPDSFRSANNQYASLANQAHSSPHSATTIPQQQRDVLLSSLQVGSVGNIYGSTALQGTNNPLLAWQMISTSTMQQQQQAQQQPVQQPPKTLAYPSPNHGSLFTSAPSLTNPLMMPYDSSYDQRTSNLQRQPISLVQLSQQQQQQQQQHHTQHHPQNQSNGLVGIIPSNATARPLRRDQLYRNMHSDLQMNTQNINLLLQQQHLAAQQQNTDLTKHVNAKPFEPTTQTPNIQSPPIMQQSLPMTQQIASTMFPQSTSQLASAAPRHQHIPNLTTQPQLHAHRHNIQANLQQQQPSPLIAPVRPRPLTNNTSLKPSVDRPNMQQYAKGNMQNVALNSRRQAPMGHNIQQHLSMSNQSLPNQYVTQTAGSVQQRNNQRNLGINMPGPIQRPSQQVPNQTATPHVNYPSLQHQQQQQHLQQQHHHPQQPLQHHQQPVQQQPVAANAPDEFKKIQRQKMLEDTKKYFRKQEQEKTVAPSNPLTEKEQIDDKQHDSSASIDENGIKKSVQPPIPTKNASNGNGTNRNVKRPPLSSSDAKKKRDPATPSVIPAGNSQQQQQPPHVRRNVTSAKV